MSPRPAMPAGSEAMVAAALTAVLLHLFDLRPLLGGEEGLDLLEAGLVGRFDLAARVAHRDRRLSHRCGVRTIRLKSLLEGGRRFPRRLHQWLRRFHLFFVDRFQLSLLFLRETQVLRDHSEGRSAGAIRTTGAARSETVVHGEIPSMAVRASCRILGRCLSNPPKAGRGNHRQREHLFVHGRYSSILPEIVIEALCARLLKIRTAVTFRDS